MRVCYIFCLLFILFGATIQMPQNGNGQQDSSVDNDKVVYLVTSQEANCLTVRNITGVCVDRSRCDYGPGAIDFTLYAPHGYKRPCKIEQACCPLKHILEVKTATPAPEGFEFDADD